MQSVSIAVLGCRALAFTVLTGLVAGCIQTTPYDVDVERTGFLADSLAELRKREPAPRPFRFVALADTHDEYDDFADTIDIINGRRDLELAVHAGDISDRGLLQEMEWSVEQLDDIDVPVFVTLGNHDAVSYGADIWQDMFGPYDYSFHFGGLKFVFFNSNSLEFAGRAPRRDWLRREVFERGDALGVVLVAHHPPDTMDDVPGGDNRAFYDELLQSGKVDLYIHGHQSASALRSLFGVPVLGCGTFQNWRQYWIVTVDGARFSFERCLFSECSTMTPEVAIP